MSNPIERVWTAEQIRKDFCYMYIMSNQGSDLAARSEQIAEYLAKCTRLMAAFKKMDEVDQTIRPAAWDIILNALRAALDGKDGE